MEVEIFSRLLLKFINSLFSRINNICKTGVSKKLFQSDSRNCFKSAYTAFFKKTFKMYPYSIDKAFFNITFSWFRMKIVFTSKDLWTIIIAVTGTQRIRNASIGNPNIRLRWLWAAISVGGVFGPFLKTNGDARLQ